MSDVGAVSGDESLAIRRTKLIADLESLGAVLGKPDEDGDDTYLIDGTFITHLPSNADATEWDYDLPEDRIRLLTAIRDRAKDEEGERCAGVAEGFANPSKVGVWLEFESQQNADGSWEYIVPVKALAALIDKGIGLLAAAIREGGQR